VVGEMVVGYELLHWKSTNLAKTAQTWLANSSYKLAKISWNISWNEPALKL
jgi:hypothetical protein